MFYRSEEFARKVYKLLMETAGALPSYEEQFVRERNQYKEWRFQGIMGFGGKYWPKRNKINCYKEDETPRILQLIEEINIELARLLKEEIVYVDMDGVIADFDKAIRKIHPTCFELEDGDERGRIIDEICEADIRIFQSLEPMDGGIEAVKLLDKYYTTYFLSTPMWNVPESFTDKRLWIEKHFGAFGTKRLILSHRKDLNRGAFLIDDRIKNGVAEFKGKHIHFGTKEFPNWSSVLVGLLPEN
jgi:5'-nucleotidase